MPCGVLPFDSFCCLSAFSRTAYLSHTLVVFSAVYFTTILAEMLPLGLWGGSFGRFCVLSSFAFIWQMRRYRGEQYRSPKCRGFNALSAERFFFSFNSSRHGSPPLVFGRPGCCSVSGAFSGNFSEPLSVETRRSFFTMFLVFVYYVVAPLFEKSCSYFSSCGRERARKWNSFGLNCCFCEDSSRRCLHNGRAALTARLLAG